MALLGHGNAVVIAALSSQNPGAITITNTVFGSNPPIPSDTVAKAFQVDSSGGGSATKMNSKISLF